jgi:glutamyl-tRNA reductase
VMEKEKDQGLNLACVGINHRTAPLDVRESMWFSAEEMTAALKRLREARAREAILISTCNRTELYYVPAGDDGERPMWEFLASLKNHRQAPGRDNFYSFSGLQPVKHLFKVVSGIDSMVLGDVQITAQVKDAYAAAVEHGATGTITNRLFTAAMHVGKRVRTETQIGEGAISVSYLAAELATKIFSDLSRRTALLIGIGETGKLTARHLASRNLGHMVIANRTFAAAEKIAPLFGGRAVPFEQLAAELPTVDIIITAVQTARPILTRADIAAAMKLRSNRPLIIVDLGVPRNVDPEINRVDNVFLHDIDSLNRIIDLNISHRRAEVPKAQKIIFEELNEFQKWTRTIQLGPTFQDLRESFEAIREQEVGRIRHRFSDADREEIDILTKRIVNKLLHAPMSNMRSAHGRDHEDTHRRISLLRHIFGLDKHH